MYVFHNKEFLNYTHLSFMKSPNQEEDPEGTHGLEVMRELRSVLCVGEGGTAVSVSPRMFNSDPSQPKPFPVT